MFHKPIPLEHRLRVATDSVYDQTHVIFGGTGAVGGETVIQMIDFYERMMLENPPRDEQIPRLVITGESETDINWFFGKLESIFPEIELKRKEIKPHYSIECRTRSGIDIDMYMFHADPSFKDVEAKTKEDIEEMVKGLSSPFEEFLTEYNLTNLRSVICGIPIPSVAAYKMGELEDVCKKANISEEHVAELKEELLHTMARSFGNIKRSQAEEVLIAHTTAVGGMYDEFADGDIRIRLGFAHSSLGDLLHDKQRFAQVLTDAYLNVDLKVLITAAAIGVNNVHFNTPLTYSSTVERQMKEKGLLNPDTKIKRYTSQTIKKGDKVKKFESEGTINATAAIESGENGLFSVDNALALYLVMKVASEEELAIPLATTALLGDDPQKPWFDSRGLSYYTETENATQVFALLNRPELSHRSTEAFGLRSFQALGSAKHQAELHTWGLYDLVHRILEVKEEDIEMMSGMPNAMEIFNEKTMSLRVNEIAKSDTEEIEHFFGELMEIKHGNELADFLDMDQDYMTGDSFNRLADSINKYVDEITSLGTPIIYRHNGVEKIRMGPYLAPLDLVISENEDLFARIEKDAKEKGLDAEQLFNWYVTNNGFIDLREEARVTTSKKAGTTEVYRSVAEFTEGVKKIKRGYFTSSGITAVVGRMQGLLEQLDTGDLRLGSHIGWKALFTKEIDGYLLIPGVVEAVRMYNEGLGKTTGTECLWPSHGYFSREPVIRKK